MELWLDGGLIIIALLFFASGFRRGVAGALAQLGGMIVAVAVASFLASMAAQPIYDHIVRGYFVQSIGSALNGNPDSAAAVQEMFAKLPAFVSHSLGTYGLSADSVNAAVAGANEQAAGAVADLLAPLVTDFIRMLLMLILVLIFMVVVRLAVHAVDTVFRLPILHQLNSLLGGVFGLVQGAVVVMLLCLAIQLIVPMLSVTPAVFSQDVIDSTKLFRYVYYNNPVYNLSSLL